MRSANGSLVTQNFSQSPLNFRKIERINDLTFFVDSFKWRVSHIFESFVADSKKCVCRHESTSIRLANDYSALGDFLAEIMTY